MRLGAGEIGRTYAVLPENVFERERLAAPPLGDGISKEGDCCGMTGVTVPSARLTVGIGKLAFSAGSYEDCCVSPEPARCERVPSGALPNAIGRGDLGCDCESQFEPVAHPFPSEFVFPKRGLEARAIEGPPPGITGKAPANDPAEGLRGITGSGMAGKGAFETLEDIGTKPGGNGSPICCMAGSEVGSIGVATPVGTKPGGMPGVDGTGGGGTGIMGEGVAVC